MLNQKMMSTAFKRVPLITFCRKWECLMLLSKRPFHGSLFKKDSKLLAPKKLALVDSPRFGYSTVEDKVPQLTQFPVFVWPSVFKTMKNLFLVRFLIRNYYDQTFDLKEFSLASQQAVEIVSSCIAKGDYDGLDGLVTEDVVADVREGATNLNLKGLSQLAVKKEDIMFSFPYEIGIVSTDDEDSRIVEITMVYHVVHGFQEYRARYEQDPPTSKELSDSIQILNYRFRRDFKKGIDPHWIVNGLNHVQPKTH